MNRFFALKYNAAQKQFVPVAEICHKKSKSAAKVKRSAKAGRAISFSILLLSGIYASNSQAGITNDAFDYQIYRDFAENKGQFTPGASNIKIYKRGNNSDIPDIVLEQPMVDFAPVSSSGVATLVAPSYIVSVAHNRGYGVVNFNGTDYHLLARNLKPREDFHAPRLDKFVVDAAPVNLLPFNLYDPKSEKIFQDKQRFPITVRVGGGIQHARLKDDKGKVVTKNVGGPYSYLTGGIVRYVFWGGSIKGVNVDKKIDWDSTLDAYPQGGDSGSPLFRWDNETQQWELAGVAHAIGGTSNAYWTRMDTAFLNKIMQQDTDPEIALNGAKAAWHDETIDAGSHSWKWNGITDSKKDVNQTKHLVFSGGGELVLTKNINQGAGGIFFDQNQHYTFSGANSDGNPFSWKGAGLDIAKGTVVDWNIDGVKGDFLHKIGEGQLNVNVINHGGLRLGDGIVALNTTSPAFSKIFLASGRGTLLINSDNSFNPNELYFNARGGILDLNGHDIEFSKIKSKDIGARIVNNNEKIATLTISPITDYSVKIHSWGEKTTKEGALFKYGNPWRYTTDYFIKKDGNHSYFPTDHSSNSDWEFVGYNQQKAIELVKKRRTPDYYIFHGSIAGNININVDSSHNESGMIFDGAINVPAGTLSNKGKNLVFQGHPVTHAYNTINSVNVLKTLGDHSVKTQPVSLDQPDWETRTFTLKQLILQQTHFHLARNAILSADIQADASTVVLGSHNLYIDLDDGDFSDTNYRTRQGTSVVTDDKDMSVYRGTVNIKNQSSLVIQENFSGAITASNNSMVSVLSAPDKFKAEQIHLTESRFTLGNTSASQASAQDITSGYKIGNLTADNSVFTLSVKNTASTENAASTENTVSAKNTESAANTVSVNNTESANNTESTANTVSANNTQHHLTVDRLAANNSEFNFISAPASKHYDQLTVNSATSGANNTLMIHYLADNTAAEQPLERASEQLIINTNKSTADNFFSLGDDEENSPYQSALAVKTTDTDKQWWLISMTDNAPWLLNEDRQYSRVDLRHGGRVTFAAPADASSWSAHRLTVGTLNASHVTFDLNARAHTGESDNIDITRQAIGDNNQLDVHFLLTSEAPLFSKDLLLASAPDATPDSYFTINPLSNGLTLLVPNGKIISKQGKKQWLLSLTDPNGSAVAETNDDAASAAATTETVSTETAIAPAPSIVAAPEVTAQPLITENSQPQPATALFNPFTLKLADLDRATDENYLHQLLQQAGINASPQQMQQYQQVIAHTASVVKDVEKLASLPKIAFVLETNQLNKRLGDVRQLGEDQGLWVKTSAGRASYQALDLRHTTLQLGVDKKIDNHLFGIMGSYTRGSSQGATSSEKHTTAGAALYYSWVPDQGMFVDVIGKYLRNYQHFTFPTDAAIAEQFPRSSTLLGSVQLGYLAKFNNAGNFNNASNNNLFIEPSIELLAGHTSGYRINGRDYSIQMKNSNPVYSKIGVAAGYQWQFAPQRAISVSASLYRLQNLHRGGAVELIGSGINNRRVHPAEWDNRYLASFSVNARLSENWRIYSQLETSFAGQLKKDITGQIALRYQF